MFIFRFLPPSNGRRWLGIKAHAKQEVSVKIIPVAIGTFGLTLIGSEPLQYIIPILPVISMSI